MRLSLLAAAAAASLVVVVPSAPASAAAPPDKAAAPPDKAAAPAGKTAVLAAWTQPSAKSYRAWNEGRLHPARWAAYRFAWTTDDCTMGPDQPAAFDFRLACRRHDFGYRNYLAAGTLAASRGRLDRALYADLRRRCATYPSLVRPVCNGLAWAYYRAARKFGADVVLGVPRRR